MKFKLDGIEMEYTVNGDNVFLTTGYNHVDMEIRKEEIYIKDIRGDKTLLFSAIVNCIIPVLCDMDEVFIVLSPDDDVDTIISYLMLVGQFPHTYRKIQTLFQRYTNGVMNKLFDSDDKECRMFLKNGMLPEILKAAFAAESDSKNYIMFVFER